jgi:hypothetical protein
MTVSRNAGGATTTSEESKDEDKFTLLLKLCVVIPVTDGNNAGSMTDLLKSWLNSRLSFGKVLTFQAEVPGSTTSLEARALVQFCTNTQDCVDCDVALVVVPPPWSTTDQRRSALQSVRQS